MSRRTRNSLACISENVEPLALEFPNKTQPKKVKKAAEVQDILSVKSAQKNAAENQKNICEMNEHMAKNNNANDTLSKNSSCEHCTHHDQQIANIMELISKIKDKQQEESQQTLLRAAKQEAKIQTLTSENIKMAAEIQALNITVEELSNDNNHIKCILDYKQNEWTKIEEKNLQIPIIIRRLLANEETRTGYNE